MTATPAPAAPHQPDPDGTNTDPETAAADRALAQLAASSGEHLAGLIADGMLDTAGQPGKLPELLFPDIPAEHVRRVWDAALPVGYRAGKRSGRPRFARHELAIVQVALNAAGYEAMGRLVARTAATIPAPSEHPVDTEQGAALGEHW